MRKINNEGLSLLKKFEGLRLNPYLDVVGIPTIGYGSTFYEDGSRVTMKDKEITEERAESILRHTLTDFETQVDRMINLPITDNQFSAIVVFCYNIGVTKLRGSTLLKLLNKGKFLECSEQFIRWNKAGGKEVAGLTNRRLAEKELFLS